MSKCSANTQNQQFTCVLPIPEGPTTSVSLPRGIPPPSASSNPASVVASRPPPPNLTRSSRSESACSRLTYVSPAQTESPNPIRRQARRGNRLEGTVWQGGQATSLTCAMAARAVGRPASRMAMSSTSGSDSTSWRKAQGPRQLVAGSGVSPETGGVIETDLGDGEAARGEEVREVGRQPHLRDRPVRHRDRRGSSPTTRTTGVWPFGEFGIRNVSLARFFLPLPRRNSRTFMLYSAVPWDIFLTIRSGTIPSNSSAKCYNMQYKSCDI